MKEVTVLPLIHRVGSSARLAPMISLMRLDKCAHVINACHTQRHVYRHTCFYDVHLKSMCLKRAELLT